MSFTKLHARFCALVLFSVGCGSSAAISVGDASCPTPDVAPPATAGSSGAGAAGSAGAAGAAGAAGSADAASPGDADAVSPGDGGAHMDALPLVDGAFGPHPDLPKGWALITVKGGLVGDLDAAVGSNSVGDRFVGDKIRVMAGYGIDYVYLDHVGRLSPPWGEPATGQPLIINMTGYLKYEDNPTQPPHPDYAPARALFDALANGPRTGNGQVGTRESPGGRIHCEVGKGTPYEASCYITGVLEASFY
jgi:hypothetical protein